MMFPLKSHSVSEIEKALSKALSDLCGATVDVKISSLVDKTEPRPDTQDVLQQAEIILTASHDETFANAI